MRDTIDVTEYCEAFKVWADASNLDGRKFLLLSEALGFLRQEYCGVYPIVDLCKEMRQWAKAKYKAEGYAGHISGLHTAIDKSCLLWRLIYAGEKLRVRPCPIHKGKWSGCTVEPCKAGCSFGSNVTGWLANEG